MKILVCPLNWGLGHATRCVPIIRKLINEGNEVTIVSDGYALTLLRQEFPTLPYIEYSSYRIRYSSGKSQIGAIAFYLPGMAIKIFKEHRWLKRMVKAGSYDMVISDNRFGLWNKDIKSIYITHQVRIIMPHGVHFLEGLTWRVHRWFMSHYDECWIPDYEKAPGLSGDLSHKYPLLKNTKFIGPLSRFEELKDVAPDDKYEVVGVLSGVEPQRSMLEKEIIERYKSSEQKVLIVRGLPQEKQQMEHLNQITIVSHIDSKELAAVYLGAKHIISRSGYTTIMDLAVLNCLDKAELIPTAGQTEQEYLALLLKK